MSNIIAVAGKGGTGKTTLAALIVRALKEKAEGPILAIDADPNSNLGELLGVKSPSTIVGIIDSVAKNPSLIPQGVTKDRYIDLKVQESLNEEEGFDLLSMGRPEGPGCYCFANNMLRGLIEKLMESYRYVVIDNEAGMEHLSRRLARNIDTLFMVSDSAIVGIRSAARISGLVDELEIKVKDRFLILNKSRGVKEALLAEIEKAGMNLRATLPLNEEIEDAAVDGRAVFELSKDNPLLKAVGEFLVVSQARKG